MMKHIYVEVKAKIKIPPIHFLVISLSLNFLPIYLFPQFLDIEFLNLFPPSFFSKA